MLLRNLQMLDFQTCCFRSSLRPESNSLHSKVEIWRFNCYKQFINNNRCSEICRCSIFKLAVFSLLYEQSNSLHAKVEFLCFSCYKQLPLLRNLQMLDFRTCCLQSPLRTESNSFHTKVEFSPFNCYKQFVNNHRCSEICRCSIFNLPVFSLR